MINCEHQLTIAKRRRPWSQSSLEPPIKLPSLGQPVPPGNIPEGPCGQERRPKGQLWQPRELQYLQNLIGRYRSGCRGGRSDWNAIAKAWQIWQATSNTPTRTIAAIKAAHQKLKRGTRKGTLGSQPTQSLTRPEDDNGDPPEAVDISKSEVNQESDETTELERFRKHVQRHLKLTKTRERPPIPRPNQKIPQRLLAMGDQLIEEQGPKLSQKQEIGQLNKMVYAIGRAIYDTLQDEKVKEGKTTPSEAIRKEKGRRSKLSALINAATSELKRRENRRTRKPGRASIREIIKRYDIKNTRGLRYAIAHMKDRLRTVQNSINELADKIGRVKVRKQGPGRIIEPRTTPKEEIPVHDIRKYWEPIVGTPKEFHVSPALERWKTSEAAVAVEVDPIQDEETWTKVYHKLRPWKAPGPDGIQAFWWKHLKNAKRKLNAWCVRAVKDPKRTIPEWIARGKVALLPKEGDPRDPGNYRPITCLNTCYKILTASIAVKINTQINGKITAEQLAMTKTIWGCSHAHIIDQSIVRSTMEKNEELHMMWVDMQKAYDSISHKAIKWCLKAIGINEQLRHTISTLMNMYKVKYIGKANGKTVQSSTLRIRNGVMQGDTLSPLLFCLTILPISSYLRHEVGPCYLSTNPSEEELTQQGKNHIFYMDDLKIYTRKHQQMVKIKKGLTEVAHDLGLGLNLKKCATYSIPKKGEPMPTQAEGNQIPQINEGESYKYLGAPQRTLPVVKELWGKTEVACRQIAERLFSSQLTIRQMVDAYNQTVIPKVKYAASCIIFGRGRLGSQMLLANKLDQDIRNILAINKVRSKTSCRARLYIDREMGGLGIRLTKHAMEDAIVYNWCYLASKPELDAAYQLALRLQRAGKRSLTKDFESIINDYPTLGNITRSQMATISIEGQTHWEATTAARQIVKQMNSVRQDQLNQEWRSKPMSSRVLGEMRPNGPTEGPLHLRDSFLWSRMGLFSKEALFTIWGTQEGFVQTNSSRSRQGQDRSSRCRMQCGSNYTETPEHIVSGCSHWRPNLMVDRHDAVCRVLYDAIADQFGIKRPQKTYHPIKENDKVKITWDSPIWTSTQINHNRPDILLEDKAANRITILEVSVSWYTRLPLQEERKYNKYAVNSCLPEETKVRNFNPGPNLQNALQKDRKCRVDVIPIVIGCCGEVTPKVRQAMMRLNLQNQDDIIAKMGRAASLGTHRIVKAHLANPTHDL